MKKLSCMLMAGAFLCLAGATTGVTSRLKVSANEASTADYISVAAPTATYDDKSYLFAVKYTWTAGEGGDRIAMSKYTNTNYSVYGDGPTYTYVAFPDRTATGSSYLCNPPAYYFKSYNTATSQYSINYTSFEHIEDGVVLYGYNCQLLAFANLSDSREAYVPTKYDQDGFIWENYGTVSSSLVATITYEGEVYNLKVTIPLLGYKSTSVTMKGVTFFMRTGPNKVSIKCDSSNVSMKTFNFAYRSLSSSEQDLLDGIQFA